MILQSEKTLHKPVKVKEASQQFYTDILKGMHRKPKTAQSKYFYDATGDGLFQQIMAMPEYYLTRCELDIFKNKTHELASIIMAGDAAFDLIELGAGDATKSSYLLQHLFAKKASFTYMPIDISGNILSVLDKKLKADVPGLDVVCLEGDYFDMLKNASRLSSNRKVVLFLGGNIGNMEAEDALSFCRRLRKSLSPGDIALIGFDLKKNPGVILDAYNDKAGITAAFNLNLLSRINRELGADFNVEDFEHYQNYDPVSGACRSYLISLKEQNVMIGEDMISFKKNEPVYMEVSQKYATEDIEGLAHYSGFSIVGEVSDSKGWFTDSLWVAE